MEQVDNIIISSLRELGCNIDEEITALNSFEPELSVKIVSKLLKIIKPECSELPDKLPQNMAQRFSGELG